VPDVWSQKQTEWTRVPVQSVRLRCRQALRRRTQHSRALWTKDVGRDVPPEWRQMQPSAEVAVPPKKLEGEAQKIPCQAGVQFDTEF